MPFRRRPPPSSLTLKRASGRPDWLALLLRILLVFALIGVVLAAHWLDRGGLHDNLDGEISFIDVLYFTMITVTTVGFGDIVPVTDRARMFDTFLVTPIRIFVWLIFLGTAYQFLLRNVWEAWVMNRIQDRLHDHVIVAGFGTSGEETVRELIRRGFPPQQIVVVDVRADRARRGREPGRRGARGRRHPQRHAGGGEDRAREVRGGRPPGATTPRS